MTFARKTRVVALFFLTLVATTAAVPPATLISGGLAAPGGVELTPAAHLRTPTTTSAASVRPTTQSTSSSNSDNQRQATSLIDQLFTWAMGSLLTLLTGLFANKQLSELVFHLGKLVVLDIEERWEREGLAEKGAAKLLAALRDLRGASWIARLLPESYLLRHLSAAVAALPGIGATGKRD